MMHHLLNKHIPGDSYVESTTRSSGSQGLDVRNGSRCCQLGSQNCFAPSQSSSSSKFEFQPQMNLGFFEDFRTLLLSPLVWLGGN